jgi:hypothetical protein
MANSLSLSLPLFIRLCLVWAILSNSQYTLCSFSIVIQIFLFLKNNKIWLQTFPLPLCSGFPRQGPLIHVLDLLGSSVFVSCSLIF